MRKLKVYLDTSVISHLMQEDVPEKMADIYNYGSCFVRAYMMCTCPQLLWRRYRHARNLKEAS